MRFVVQHETETAPSYFFFFHGDPRTGYKTFMWPAEWKGLKLQFLKLLQNACSRIQRENEGTRSRSLKERSQVLDWTVRRHWLQAKNATVVQQLCKSCRTCFKFYCMFYFTCDRSLTGSSQEVRKLETSSAECIRPQCAVSSIFYFTVTFNFDIFIPTFEARGT